MVVRKGLARDHCVGMTLVEIMITLVIASILAGSTFMFFAGQQRIYETQTKMLNIQQNLWASMEVVARYARAAGSGMFECTRPASYAIEGSTPGARARSTYPSPTPLSPDLGSRPATGLRAYDDTTATLQWIPPIWIVNNSSGTGPDSQVRPGTDVLTVAFGNRTSGTDIDAILGADITNSTAGNMTLSTAGTDAMFRVGEFVLAMRNPPWSFGSDPSSDRGCTLFQITAIPGTGTMLTHASTTMNGGRTWNPTGVVADMMPTDPATSTAMIYPEGTAGLRNFGQLTWIRFYVSDGANGIPNLMMQRLDLPAAGLGVPQILAEGIEDLQVAYACDTGSLGAPNLLALNGTLDEGTTVVSRQTDEWVNNVENDIIAVMNTDGFCNVPPAIRITLIARSLFPDNLIDPVVTNNGPMDVEDHIQTTSPRPLDQFRRRILNTTIFPRNNRPTL